MQVEIVVRWASGLKVDPRKDVGITVSTIGQQKLAADA